MYAIVNASQRVAKREPLFAGRPCGVGRRQALVSILAAFGILAFIFSAISPVDDDVQPDFFQRSKSKQIIFVYRAASTLQTFRIRTVHSALATPTPQFASYDVTARLAVCGDQTKNRVCINTAGDRSPPSKSA